MSKVLATLLLLVLAVSSGIASAAVNGTFIHELATSYDLQTQGRSGGDQAQQLKIGYHSATFIGLVTGVVISHPMLETSGERGRDFDISQCCAMVSKYTREHPEEWDLRGEEIIFRALKPKFGRGGK
jgi:hypothetical protein